jgi:quercetin 2,3-dioxygenase
LQTDEAINYDFAPGRVAWLQVAKGSVKLNDRSLMSGDGAAIAQETAIALQGLAPNTEVLLFDMAA